MSYKIIKPKYKTTKDRMKLLMRSAKKRNISVNLNEYYYEKLFNLGCGYCGKSLKEENGYCVDRQDNTKGYIEGNLQPCCKICNRAKGNLTNWEFFDWIKAARNHQEKEIKQYHKMLLFDEEFKRTFNKKTKCSLQGKSAYRNAETYKLEGKR